MSDVRLIDANALKNKFISTISVGRLEFEDIINLIDNAPTINKCDNCDLMFKEKTKKGGITE